MPDVPPGLGQGALFVLVHAAGGTAGSWRPQLTAFAEHHSAIAIDFPGHGRSSGLDALDGLDAYAGCLLRVLEAWACRPAVLVGRSMGGAIAMRAACLAPDRVAGLVLAGTALAFDVTPQTLALWRDVVHGRKPQQFTDEAFSPGTDFEVKKQAWSEQVRTDPRVALGDLQACADFDGGEIMSRVAVPTLVLVGADDQVTPPAATEALAGAIAGARHEVIARAGHQLPLEQPDAFNAAVLRFAESLS